MKLLDSFDFNETESDSKRMHKELWVLALFSILATLFFFNSYLDLKSGSFFYHPDNSDPWFEQDLILWKFFYFAAPVITGLIIFPCIVLFVMSFIKEKFLAFRKISLFVVLSVLLGPGLVINTVFKPYWGRPRPRQVQELGGQYHYQVFWQKGISRQGMSFPCGHSSVGYVVGVLYFPLVRRRKKLAQIVLFSSLMIGTMMGIGRMAAGGHFLSDVVWSALACFWGGWLIFYKIMPKVKTEQAKTNRKTAWFIGVFLSVSAVIALMLASPFYFDQKYRKENIESFVVEIDHGDVTVEVDLNLKKTIEIEAQIKGFGLPNNKLVVQANQNLLAFQRKGFFTDYEGVYKIKISPDLEMIKIHNGTGPFQVLHNENHEKYNFSSDSGPVKFLK